MSLDSLTLDDAVKAQQKGDFAQAEEFYKTLLLQEPDNVAVLEFYGVLLLKTQKEQAAKQIFQKALQRNPASFIALYHLGNLSLIEEDIASAKQYYELALNQYNQHQPSLLNLAACYVKENQREKAKEIYHELLSYYPEDGLTHENLAVLYFYEKNVEKAIHHYLEILYLDKNHFNAHFQLGIIFMDQFKWESAQSHLQAALSAQPENVDAHYNYATVLSKLSYPQSAIYHLKKTLELDATHAYAKFRLQSLTGEESPAIPPEGYVARLFDNYAERFDSDVLEKLQYDVPNLLHEALKPFLVEKNSELGVDLGCGTGLCGKWMKEYVTQLEGVDVSSKMLEIAAKKNYYHQLYERDIEDFLKTKIENIDLLIAGDVLVYVGDLTSLLTVSVKALKSSGFFAFTVECQDEKNYQLTKNSRYAHSNDYIINILKSLPVSIEKNSPVVLRLSAGEKVWGRLYLVRKNDSFSSLKNT